MYGEITETYKQAEIVEAFMFPTWNKSNLAPTANSSTFAGF